MNRIRMGPHRYRITGRQLALFPGTEDRVGFWLTPKPLMNALEGEFRFTFDACPYPRPAGFDGIREEWGERTWVNPPFMSRGGGHSLNTWARKAVEEHSKGKTVVMIGPTERWITNLMNAGAEVRVVGNVYWESPDGRKQKGGGRPQLLFVLRPRMAPSSDGEDAKRAQSDAPAKSPPAESDRSPP